ncbi:hypothetical protein TNCV_4026601 [Trichonephila clavipes]|nr:hypothetical protein TNCV_4026601 [Trichonephila clavipes]
MALWIGSSCVRWPCWLRHVSDGLVSYVVDRWYHDCCDSVCTARVTNKGRLELDTFRPENEYLSPHAKTIVIEFLYTYHHHKLNDHRPCLSLH